MQTVEIVKLKCYQCGHEWMPRQPKVWHCPKCKSPEFDQKPEPAPQKKKPVNKPAKKKFKLF